MPAHTDRSAFIGGSDARIIMGNDETALVGLWREKRGEIPPEDLSANLAVQLGNATEDLNRLGHSDARSATNLPCRSAVSIINNCIATVTKPPGARSGAWRPGFPIDGAWWANVQIAPIEVAKQLWEASLLQVHCSAPHSQSGTRDPEIGAAK